MTSDLQASIRLVSGDDPSPNKPFGTGFAIYEDEEGTYFVTCKHVITQVGGPGQVRVDHKIAQVIASGSDDGPDDLAVLRAEGLKDIPLLKLGSKVVKEDSFVATGFQLVANHYLLRPIHGHVGEKVSLETTQPSTRIKAWNLTIENNQRLQRGYSGTPVVNDESDQVFGVVSFRLDEGKEGLAISIEALKQIWPEMPPHLLEQIKPPPISHPQAPLALWDRISQKEYWDFLEQAVVQAATAGGVAAMSYYRRPLQWPSGLADSDAESKNPSTVADLQATAAIIHTMYFYLSRVVDHLDCRFSFLGEETKYQSWFEKNLDDAIVRKIRLPEEIFTDQDNNLRVIIDGVDGTGSFSHGIPLFCSAVAILIGDRPRVSAIYDPFHNTVYSAVLPGPYDNLNAGAKANAWRVATGTRTDLIQLARETEQRKLRSEAIGIHLTRTNTKKLHEYFTRGILERLATASGATYALNSGIVAMTDIARGALGGFVNNVTNLWDVAAGEVIVKACRGVVTNFDGRMIDYSGKHTEKDISKLKTSVVAAKAYLHEEILDILQGKSAV